MREHIPPADDSKDMVIEGCRVHLIYGHTAENRWTVRATIECGIGDALKQSFVSGAFDSRDAAERDALEQVTAHLGNNKDRSYSRIRNWN